MTHRIVVLGAGYAGLTAARKLARRARRTGVAVTLVNRAEVFVERIRLHQVAAGQRLPSRRLADLAPELPLVVATVTAVDATARLVHLDAPPHRLTYDTLLYALGSDTDTATVPGVAEHAHAVGSYASAVRLRERLARLHDEPVVVVGGGLTGVETAAELAEAHPELAVTLVTADLIGTGIGTHGRRHLHHGLGRLRVTVREGERAAAVTPAGLRLADGGVIPASVVVWTAGFRVPSIAAEAGIAVDDAGRILVDDRLRSVSHPDIYAAGDAAAARAAAGEARMSCQTAMPMGLRVADIIAARLAGGTPRPMRVRYVWQNISLGRRDALTQFVHHDDRPRRAVLTGRAAAAFKEVISRGTMALLRRPYL